MLYHNTFMDFWNSIKKPTGVIVVLLLMLFASSSTAQIWSLPDKSKVVPPTFPVFGKSRVVPAYSNFFYSQLPAYKQCELTICNGEVVDSSVFDGNRYLIYCKQGTTTYLFSYKNNYKHIKVECKLSTDITYVQEFYYNNHLSLDSLTVTTIENRNAVRLIVMKCCIDAKGRVNTTNYYRYANPKRQALLENLVLEDFEYNMSLPQEILPEMYCDYLVYDLQKDKQVFKDCEDMTSLLRNSADKLPCVGKALDRVSKKYSYLFENDSLVFYGEFQNRNEDNKDMSYLIPQPRHVSYLYTKFGDCMIGNCQISSGHSILHYNQQFFVRKRNYMLASHIDGVYWDMGCSGRPGNSDTTINRFMLRNNLVIEYSETKQDTVNKFLIKRFRL